jgi:hypothetical protein
MKIVNQDVPSDLFSAYSKCLTPSYQKWSNLFNTFTFGGRKFGTGPSTHIARKRSPWRLPSKQNSSTQSPSHEQRLVRLAFIRCILAFSEAYKNTDRVDEFGNGPIARATWYNLQDSRWLWYYNVFISYTWQYLFDNEPPSWALMRSFHTACPYWSENDPSAANNTNYDPYFIEGRVYLDDAGDTYGESFAFLQIDPGYHITRWSNFWLYVYSGGCTVSVFGVPDDNLDLSSLTWNNKPSIGPLLRRVHLPAGVYRAPFFTYSDQSVPDLFSDHRRTIAITFHSADASPPGAGAHGLLASGIPYPHGQRPYLAP